jgi:MFS family permease
MIQNKDHQLLEVNNKEQSCPFMTSHKSLVEEKQVMKCPNDEIIKPAGNHENESTDVENKKCVFVELKEGASYLNLITFYMVQFSYVCFFSFLDSMQPHLLEPKEGYIHDISNEDEVIQANIDLVFYDNLYLCGFIYLFGAFHDIIGRKIICAVGFFLIGIALVLYPLAGSVYPNLILVRLIFSNGICGVVTQPLLADYVKHTSKGFCGGISAFLSGCGALFAVFVLMKMKDFLNYTEIYFITAGLSFFVGAFCLFGVKNIQPKSNEVNVFSLNCLKTRL